MSVSTPAYSFDAKLAAACDELVFQYINKWTHFGGEQCSLICSVFTKDTTYLFEYFIPWLVGLLRSLSPTFSFEVTLSAKIPVRVIRQYSTVKEVHAFWKASCLSWIPAKDSLKCGIEVGDNTAKHPGNRQATFFFQKTLNPYRLHRTQIAWKNLTLACRTYWVCPILQNYAVFQRAKSYAVRTLRGSRTNYAVALVQGFKQTQHSFFCVCMK